MIFGIIKELAKAKLPHWSYVISRVVSRVTIYSVAVAYADSIVIAIVMLPWMMGKENWIFLCGIPKLFKRIYQERKEKQC